MASFFDIFNAPGTAIRDAIRPVAPWLVTPLSDTFAQMREANPASSTPISSRGGKRWYGSEKAVQPSRTPYVSHSPTDALYRNSANLLSSAPASNEVVKDASYYLGQATNALPGVDFSGLRDRAQTSVSDTDARVRAMYKAMREIQAEEAANREASRSAAGESIAQSADQAASDIAQGYDNAISALADEMAALGLGETLAQEPAQRVAAESGRQQAISRQIGQISGDLNTGLGQAEAAYGQDIRDITGLEGADFRSQLQKDLLNQLANYDMAEQQQNQDLAQQRLSYASGLRNYEQSFEPATMSISDQLAAQRIANDASQTLAQRQDEMFQFFMDKKGMDAATAAQAVNDYFAGANQ